MTSPEQMRDAWDKFAAGYDDAVTPFTMRIAEDALRRVDIRPGIRLLDVAAGGGALSIPAARLGAQVLATDFSPAMVGRLNARARDEVRLEASYLSNRQPESSPTCELRVPFQKRDGGWLDYTVNIEGQADR